MCCFDFRFGLVVDANQGGEDARRSTRGGGQLQLRARQQEVLAQDHQALPKAEAVVPGAQAEAQEV